MPTVEAQPITLPSQLNFPQATTTTAPSTQGGTTRNLPGLGGTPPTPTPDAEFRSLLPPADGPMDDAWWRKVLSQVLPHLAHLRQPKRSTTGVKAQAAARAQVANKSSCANPTESPATRSAPCPQREAQPGAPHPQSTRAGAQGPSTAAASHQIPKGPKSEPLPSLEDN